jgi:hypothetical protein
MDVVKVCFATWELKPFSRGGIGVLIHNILKTYCLDQSEVSILWYGDTPIDEGLFRLEFPMVNLFLADEWVNREEDDFYLDKTKYTIPQQWRSVQVMRALRNIEAVKGSFDVIEFPDFDGIAFSTLQEKNLRRAFAHSLIAVRVHSTEAALRRFDHRQPTFANAARRDFERKALNDADVVIGHLDPVVASVVQTFGFSEQWLQKVVIDLPPILINKPAAKSTTAFTETSPLVFTSKIQWVKQPQVFINAVVGFMLSTPAYVGDAFLLAHLVEGQLVRHCQQLIPIDLLPRFKFIDTVDNELRESVIARSIAICPSAYESFCLAAYEASALGALSILNGDNPAFGNDTPWKQHVNCEKFDGTSGSLLALLCKLWERREQWRLQPLALSAPTRPYWLSLEKASSVGLKDVQPASRELSLVILAGDAFGDPVSTIQSAFLAGGLKTQIILVYDLPPTDVARLAVLDRLRHSFLVDEGHVAIIELGFRGGAAAQANLGLRAAQHEIVGFARAGAHFDPSFLIEAVSALTELQQFSFVIPQTEHVPVLPKEKTADEDRSRIGESINSALSEQHLFGDFEFIGRRSALTTLAFDENLDRFIEVDFHLRACTEGYRYIVGNRVDAHVDLTGAILSRDFRRHFDAVLVKYDTRFDGGTLNLVSAYDSEKIFNFAESAVRDTAVEVSLPGGRTVSYYINEKKPWWEVAIRHPLRIKTWLLLREFQATRFSGTGAGSAQAGSVRPAHSRKRSANGKRSTFALRSSDPRDPILDDG